MTSDHVDTSAAAGAAVPPSPTGFGGDREPLYGPEFAADPGRTYARLRRFGSLAPVELAPGVPATLVIGYDAALDVLRDPATFPKDPRTWQQGIPADCPILPMLMYRPNCMLTDGAVHARLRGAVTDSLGRIDVSALRGYVERNADTLIDRFAGDGEADLVGQYAKVLPLMVFNELFGCTPEIADRLVYGMTGIFDGIDAEQANGALIQGTMELVALKRRRPGADVTSWLIGHPARLTDEELVHQLILLMGAGTEPEQNIITNTLRLLLSDPRFAGELSGGNLPIENALDEVLWTDPPIANYGTTFPQQHIGFAGAYLAADQPVLISFAAANTDPSRFADHRMGNRAHLAWGAGPHTCPAKSPARLIASAAIENLLDRLPDLRLAVPVHELRWRPGPFHRALYALPVTFPPAPAPTPPVGAVSGAWRWDAGQVAGQVAGQAAPRRPTPTPVQPLEPAPATGREPSHAHAARPGSGRPAGRLRGLLTGWWRGR